MRHNRSCTSFITLPWIDHAPITPLDPIAFRAVVARSEGQGRRHFFQQANSIFMAFRLEDVCRRRSLALDGSEHDGRLTDNRDGHACTSIPLIMKLLCACIIAAVPPAAAIAGERDIGAPGSIAIAVSSAQKFPSAHSSASTSIADRWAEHIAEASHRFSLPERWIRAVMIAESGGDAHALSPAGAMGLMQIMPATWQELRTRHDLGDDSYDPRDNILAGAAYLAELHDLYGSPGFLAAYNAGRGRYEKHIVTGAPLPAETRAYVAKIMPMIGADAAVALQTTDRPARAEWSAATLFVGRLTLPSGNKQAAEDHRSVRPSSDGTITDGLFIPMSRHGVAE